MNCYYDFHIHSALSPCAEEEMTPNNIVNMGLVNGLDMIAVTDHNSARNLPAIWKCAADKGLLLVPGIEVESIEEVHISCLFPQLEAAEEMGRFVGAHLPPINNKAEIFGPQYIFDAHDRITGEEERLLLVSTDLTAERVFQTALSLSGCAYFSHVDRDSYSVLSALGTMPADIQTSVVEVSDSQAGRQFAKGRKDLADKRFLYSSDCHRLSEMSKRKNKIDLPQMTTQEVINWIKDMR